MTSIPVKIKIMMIHIIMPLFLILLFLNLNKINGSYQMLIFFSTLILILHLWLGAFYIVKYLKREDTLLNIMLDAMSLLCIFFAIEYINNMVIWSILFAILFANAIVIYWLVNIRTKEKKIKEYTSTKIRNEIIAVPLFLAIALAEYLSEGQMIAMITLRILVFAGQAFFAVWLIQIKKVYKILN